jgi:hypothetical protein
MPSLQVFSQRQGNVNDHYTKIPNRDRVGVGV